MRITKSHSRQTELLIAVIIPTWNEEECIERTLRHVRKTANGAAVEVIVVDGGSADRTREVALALADRVLVSPARGRAAQMHVGAETAQGKYLVIRQAGKESHEGMARAVHALLYTRELKEHGHEVVLAFDGAGTEWAEEWTKPDSTHKLTPMYRELSKLGVTEIICDFCAGAFQVKDALKSRKVELTGEFQGHPSIAKWADKGYQLVIL